MNPHCICGICRIWKVVAFECRGMPAAVDGHLNPDMLCQDCYYEEEKRKREELEWLNSLQGTCEKCGTNFLYPKTETTPPARCKKCAGIVRKCSECGQQFDSEIPARFCSDKCDEAWHKKKDIERAEKWWIENCPAGYRDTDLARLPNAAASKSVLEWEHDPTGLYLKGKTGTGKTRSIYLLLKRLVLEGFSVRFLTASGFARELGGIL